MPAKAALDSPQKNGSKRQLDNRMTPPPKVRESVIMLKDRFAAPSDADMLEEWADRPYVNFSKENCKVQHLERSNPYAPVQAGG